MKKSLILWVVTTVFFVSIFNKSFSQNQTDVKLNDVTQTIKDSTKAVPVETSEITEAPIEEEFVDSPEETGLHKVLKNKFIEGGVPWMTPILLILIIGLAIVIERIIYLNLATTNTEKLLLKVEEALENKGVEAAKEICRETRGPVASIFYQGLSRYDQGIEIVEKSIISYGSVQTGNLEKGLSWITLGIALAPMLGFLGTVVGMVQAFDRIEVMGEISPAAVAGGIKVALLTTIFGLIVAMILQLFYNYLISKIDSLIHQMENSSISMMDILVKYQRTNKTK